MGGCAAAVSRGFSRRASDLGLDAVFRRSSHYSVYSIGI